MGDRHSGYPAGQGQGQGQGHWRDAQPDYSLGGGGGGGQQQSSYHYPPQYNQPDLYNQPHAQYPVNRYSDNSNNARDDYQPGSRHYPDYDHHEVRQ